jgi:putative DNA primase/helicase
MLDYDGIAAAALPHLESLCCEWLPGGKKDGVEYVATNPTRGDRKAGSFRINTVTGVWCDFASDDSGSDVIALVAYLENVKQGEAARRLSKRLGMPIEERKAPPMDGSGKLGTSTAADWIAQPHAPKGVKFPSFRHPAHGLPSAQWEYKTADGLTIGYVCRYEIGDGAKDVIPFSWCRHKDTGETKWRMRGFPTPRALYGLDRLAQRPDASVIVVEGEKSADAAARIMPDFVAVSWPGGGKGVRHCDWSPLAGRRVFIWPDRDRHVYNDKDAPTADDIGSLKPWEEQPGCIAAVAVSERVAESNVLIPPEGKVDGWDAADAESEGFDPVAFWFAAPDNIPEDEFPEDVPPDDDIYCTDRIGGMPFRLLGSDRGIFYYMPDVGGQIVELTPGAHAKNNLFQLSPLQAWESNFPGSNGVNWDAAANGLIQRQLVLPKFSPRRVRGRGCWIDGQDVIFHAGDRLIVNGSEKLIQHYRSTGKWIYNEGFDIPTDSGDIASNEEAAKLRDLCELLSWERPLYGKLLAGWMAIAPICGVLPWRPHVWLTGGAGTGKSWIVSNIVHPMVGKTALNVQSSTTEAGIRQELGSDALPVVFDEAEGEDKRSSARIDMILELARQASTETGASIMKGSAGGKSMSFLIRSCFLFASIGVSAAKKSDTSRTTVLTLRKRTGDDQTEHFERIKNAWKLSIGQAGFTDRIRSRCLQMAKVIRINSETFSRVAVEFTGDKRSADQIGTLLAGAFSLTSQKVITDTAAHDWMARQDWTGFQAEEVDSDERACLNHLLSATVRVEAGGFNSVVSIGEVIVAIVEGNSTSVTFNREAESALSRSGVRIDLISRHILVANRHQALGRVFDSTQWPSKWHQQLERINGAEKLGPTHFGGQIKQRATKIPFEAFDVT